MILLWGIMEDAPMYMALTELQKAGADFFFLDHRKIFNSDIEYIFDAQNGAKCIINTEGTKIDMSNVHAAYIRPYNFRDYSAADGKAINDPMIEKAAGFELQLMAWLDASDTFVLNRSDPSATNNSKPYQLSLIGKAGFKIPETFISNNTTLTKQFLNDTIEAVYKSISSVRSIVHTVSDNHLVFLDDVQWCPTLFQKVVPGINYRAHVFKEEIYAVRIESDRLDYRYGQTTMVAEELPYDIAQKCYRINQMLGLHFSGIDLMRTANDEWYCFEVNPSPAYSYFQSKSGLPISAALAKFLIGADVPQIAV